MTLVPAETPVTTPELLTVATPGEADVHGVVAWGVAVPVNVVVLPAQALNVPDMVGSALIVTVADTEQPLSLLKVITLVPTETAVTIPALSIVATPGEADDHGVVGCGVCEPVSVVVPPIQTLNVPDIVKLLKTLKYTVEGAEAQPPAVVTTTVASCGADAHEAKVIVGFLIVVDENTAPGEVLVQA